MLKIRPLYDRLVIKREDEEETSKGGIILTESAKEKPSRGKILAIGEGKLLDNGTLRQSPLKVGDQVLFGKYAGTEVSLSGQDVLVMREEDIMGVIEG